jgi:hypothetical protein
MASIKIITNTIARKVPRHFRDDGYDCIVSSDGIMKFHHYHEDGDFFAFARIVFAKEILTIFIPEIFGFNFHNHLEESEFNAIDEMEENMHGYMRDDLEKVIFNMFPGFARIHYGPQELETAIATYKTTLAARVHTLASVFPPLVLAKIVKHHVPTWVATKHTPAHLATMLKLDSSDHRTAFFWFLDFSLVKLKINVV